jgi:hypothetical protein
MEIDEAAKILAQTDGKFGSKGGVIGAKQIAYF